MKRNLLTLLLGAILLAGCAAPVQPASTPVIDTGVDAKAWALVPAGPFLYGLHEEETAIDYDYEMMVTPVTNEQYAAYLNAALADGTLKIAADRVVGYYPGDPFSGKKHEEPVAAGDWPYFPLNAPGSRIAYQNGIFAALPGYENHPAVMVTWFGALGYCEAQGGRLPSEREWEKAARGSTDNRAYPWGDALAPNLANYYASQDLFERVLGKQGETTPVGYYNGRTYPDGYVTRDSASPYGLYDMAGNVWQWTADVTPGIHYRYLRGGSHADWGYNLRVWTRNNVRPDYAGISIGFRCARDAQGKDQ